MDREEREAEDKHLYLLSRTSNRNAAGRRALLGREMKGSPCTSGRVLCLKNSQLIRLKDTRQSIYETPCSSLSHSLLSLKRVRSSFLEIWEKVTGSLFLFTNLTTHSCVLSKKKKKKILILGKNNFYGIRILDQMPRFIIKVNC